MYAIVRYDCFEERVQSFEVPEGTTLDDIDCRYGRLTLNDVWVEPADDDESENGPEKAPTHVELVDAATYHAAKQDGSLYPLLKIDGGGGMWHNVTQWEENHVLQEKVRVLEARIAVLEETKQEAKRARAEA